MNEITFGGPFLFSWRMLLKYGSTIELSSPTSRKRKLKKKENGAAQESGAGKTMALFGVLFFKTMMDILRQIYDPHLDS